MSNTMRGAVYVFCGVCWCAFAVLLAFLAVRYIANGADIHLFIFSISPLSVLFAWVKLLGLIFAAVVSLGIGINLFVRGVTPPEHKKKGHP